MHITRNQRLILYPLLMLVVALAMRLLDVPVARWVHDHETPVFVHQALRLVRLPGYFGFTIVLVAVLVWHGRCRWRTAGWVLLCGVAASGVTAVAKLVFGRLRPFKGREAFDWSPCAAWPWDAAGSRNLSFPSGDATLAFATAAAISVVYPRWRTPAWMWATAVAITRVLQGAHYPADVAAGALVAIAVTDLLLSLDRRTRPTPALAPPATA